MPNISRIVAASLVLTAATAGCASRSASQATQAAGATPAPVAAASAAAATATAATAGSAATQKLPSAREVVDRYVKAIGGRERLMKHSSRRMTGTIEIPAVGIRGDMVASAAKPNKMHVSVTIPGLGETRQGYDGTVGWSMDPASGPRVLSGRQLEQRKLQADFYNELHDPKSYASMETTELVDFEGTSAYKVRLIRAAGDTTYEMFDTKSGLMVGNITTQESPMGAVTVTSVIADYKPFGGLLMPTRVTQKLPTGQQVVATISSVEYDVVTPATFDLPTEIKALVGGGK